MNAVANTAPVAVVVRNVNEQVKARLAKAFNTLAWTQEGTPMHDEAVWTIKREYVMHATAGASDDEAVAWAARVVSDEVPTVEVLRERREEEKREQERAKAAERKARLVAAHKAIADEIRTAYGLGVEI